MPVQVPDRACRLSCRVCPPHGDVPARRYRTPTDARAALVWVHGGSWTGGDLDMPEADSSARGLAGRGIPVLSIDYRKAVDGVHLPVPSDDVLAAWRWASDHAAGLGIGAAALHLGGASAGGNLVAGVALRLRDAGESLPASLVLLYPVLHAVLPPARPELAAALKGLPAEYRFTPDVLTGLARNYAGSDAGLRDPAAFPAEGDVGGFPPAFIINSEVDDLRTSGEAFGEQLAAAGVMVRVETEPGTLHGHLNRPGDDSADRSLDRVARWLDPETA